MKFIALLLLSALSLSAVDKNPLVNTRWQMISMTKIDTNESEYVDSRCTTTLEFNEERYSGRQGVDGYSGKYQLGENFNLTMEPPIDHRILTEGCHKFFRASLNSYYPKVVSFRIQNDSLFL